MRFFALFLVAACVCAQDFEELPHGPEPDFSHTEYLARPVQLTATGDRRASTTFKPSSSNAVWMRLIFDEVELPHDAKITIRSAFDGDEQYLDSTSLKEWSFHTAFLNGDELEVTVESKSEATVSVAGMIVGEEPPFSYRNASQRTLCFNSDNRLRAQSRRKDARFMLGGGYCSAWLINDQNGCFLSAGHCSPSSNAVFQFNVPDSTTGGGVQNPAVQYQFPINAASNQGVNGGAGNDWRYIGANVNSNTGLSPRQYMATNGYILSTTTSTPPMGSAWQLYGHGSATGRNNLVLKGSQGAFSGRAGNRVQYRVSSTGGDSGSGVTYPGSGGDSDGTAVAIHTHGGCTASGGANSGTWIRHAALQSALNNPRGVCLTGY